MACSYICTHVSSDTSNCSSYATAQVINDPNVITIQRELPKEQALLAAIYSCNYAAFFKAVSLPLCLTAVRTFVLQCTCCVWWLSGVRHVDKLVHVLFYVAL
jgi:hypothetical protein